MMPNSTGRHRAAVNRPQGRLGVISWAALPALACTAAILMLTPGSMRVMSMLRHFRIHGVTGPLSLRIGGGLLCRLVRTRGTTANLSGGPHAADRNPHIRSPGGDSRRRRPLRRVDETRGQHRWLGGPPLVLDGTDQLDGANVGGHAVPVALVAQAPVHGAQRIIARRRSGSDVSGLAGQVQHLSRGRGARPAWHEAGQNGATAQLGSFGHLFG